MGWNIFDGDTWIAHVFIRGAYVFDIWKFSPFEAAEMANLDGPNTVYDLHTVHNTAINLPFTAHWGGKSLVEGIEDPFTATQFAWLQASGAELRLRITGTFTRGQRIQADMRFS